MKYTLTSRTYFLLLIFAIGKMSVIAQSPIFQTSKFTVEDGLPSNECHDVVQDSFGFIWIATDRGISRFDGYKFQNYGFQEGLMDISCLDLVLDSNNDIWINTLSKKFFKYKHSIDSIVEYKFNHLLEPFRDYAFFDKFYVDQEGVLYIAALGKGILIVNQQGVLVRERSSSEYLSMHPFFVDETVLCLKDDFDMDENLKESDPSLVIYDSSIGQINRISVGCPKFEKATSVSETSNNLYNNLSTRIYGLGGKYWFANLFGRTQIFDDCMQIGLLDQQAMVDFVSLGSAYFSASILERQVLYYKNKAAFLENEASSILGGAKFSRILIDQNQNLFVTSLDQGLFYLKKTVITSASYFEGKEVFHIASNDQDRLYVNVEKKELIEFQPSQNTQSIIASNLTDLRELKIDKKQNALLTAGNPSCSYNLNSGIQQIIMGKHKSFPDLPLRAKYIAGEDSVGWMMLSPSYFTFYKQIDAPPIFSSFGGTARYRIFDAINYEDGFLLGMVDGLHFWNMDTITSLQHLSPLFNQRINDINIINDTILIATTGSGLVFWDGEETAINLTTEDGLASNNIENILVNEKGQIVCGSYAGVSIIDPNRIKISNYNSSHGLPSNQVFDLAELNGDLYIGTSKGMGVIEEEKVSRPSKKVTIKSASLSGNGISLDSLNPNFNYTQNNLSVEYVTLDFEMNGKIQYRYRLNGHDWTESKSTSANYPDLPPGDYSFEISSLSNDGIWNEPTYFEFHICYAWYKQWYFNLTLFCLSAFFIYLIYKRNIDKLKEENAIKQEIRELEKAALQAQMNPHFIFNCLNSIQSYIVANEKEQAMEYLSKFAKLIRQNLDASVESKITLKEEVKMLENYLDLERIRFNGVFDYKITVDRNLDVIDTKISPMLIQPFVENAVLHGMVGKASGGFINVSFEKQDEHMMFVVSDNGPGIDFTKNGKTKSLGSNITYKRLQFANTLPLIKSDEFGTEIRVLLGV